MRRATGFLFVLAMLLMAADAPRSSSIRLVKDPNWSPAAGDMAHVFLQKPGERAFLTRDFASYKRINTFTDANDVVGIDQMLKSGAAVEMSHMTPILIIQTITVSQPFRGIPRQVPFAVEFRVTDGTLKDRSGFLVITQVARLVEVPQPTAAKKKAPKPVNPDVKAAANLFKTARELEKGGKFAEAIDSYHRLANSYPDAPETRMATARLKALEGK